jgi:hypothetical protein
MRKRAGAALFTVPLPEEEGGPSRSDTPKTCSHYASWEKVINRHHCYGHVCPRTVLGLAQQRRARMYGPGPGAPVSVQRTRVSITQTCARAAPWSRQDLVKPWSQIQRLQGDRKPRTGAPARSCRVAHSPDKPRARQDPITAQAHRPRATTSLSSSCCFLGACQTLTV